MRLKSIAEGPRLNFSAPRQPDLTPEQREQMEALRARVKAEGFQKVAAEIYARHAGKHSKSRPDKNAFSPKEEELRDKLLIHVSDIPKLAGELANEVGEHRNMVSNILGKMRKKGMVNCFRMSRGSYVWVAGSLTISTEKHREALLRRADILKALRQKPLTVTKIAEMWGLSTDSAKGDILALFGSGLVQRRKLPQRGSAFEYFVEAK